MDTKTLYEKDFAAWIDEQVNLIRTKKFEQLDIDHLIEEIEDLPGQKNALTSYLRNIIEHMLKQKYCPDPQCMRIWQVSIDTPRDNISDILEQYPGWAKHLREIFETVYQKARNSAAKHTGLDKDVFPEKCPWTLEKILGQ